MECKAFHTFLGNHKGDFRRMLGKGKAFSVAKNPDKLLSVVVSVVQLGNILMGGHPTKSKEYKEKRIKEISEEFKIPTEDVRKLLSRTEPVYTK
jgi:hypothetical protein